MAIRISVIILLMCQLANVFGQTMTFEQFIGQVKSHHPLVKQSDLEIELGDAFVMQAKGAFDPNLVSSIREKYFGEDQYYSELTSVIQIPTWFGIEVESGYDRNIGNYVSPNSATNNAGLLFGGISVPVGKGLIIDKRRNELSKAKIYKESTKATQALMRNELLLKAGYAYWNWFEAWNNLKIFDDAVKASRDRFNAVKASSDLGDRSAIDTVEANIQLQNRQIQYAQGQVNLKNTRVQLAQYLWLDGIIPVELKDSASPVSIELVECSTPSPEFRINKDSMLANHPSIKVQKFDLLMITQEIRFKREQLKPKLDLKYRPLVSPGADFSSQNFSWGVDLSIPLFLRNARGQLALTQIKSEQTKFKLIDKSMQLNVKIQQAFNKWELSSNQYDRQQAVTDNYELLLSGENELFNLGESSLFLINQRELAFIKSKLKMTTELAKNQRSAIEASYHLGVLR